jgi:SnoaL-like polyketide cyclase
MDHEKESSNRVARLRRMIEEGKDDNLFSFHYVNRTPWYQAIRRVTKDRDEVGASFEPESLFSDSQISVEEAIEKDDKVVIRWRLRGKWTKQFAGLKANGREVDITGTNIYRFVGDQIVESDGQFDAASLSQQAIGGEVSAEACQAALSELSRPPDFVAGGLAPAD